MDLLGYVHTIAVEAEHVSELVGKLLGGTRRSRV